MKFIPEKLILNYGEEVYQKISHITGLKFKTQIKGSGIVFKRIYEMTDLISNKKYYLVITNSSQIKFKDKHEFIQGFIYLIKKSIEKLNTDYKDLCEQQTQAVIDENWIFIENERIGYTGSRQLELLNRMRDLREEYPDVNASK